MGRFTAHAAPGPEMEQPPRHTCEHKMHTNKDTYVAVHAFTHRLHTVPVVGRWWVISADCGDCTEVSGTAAVHTPICIRVLERNRAFEVSDNTRTVTACSQLSSRERRKCRDD